MKNPKETTNPSKKIDPLPKKRPWEALLEKGYMNFPGKTECRERLCYTLMLWAGQDDALDIQQFSDFYGIDRDILRRWAIKYPEDIGVAFKNAKLTLGLRKRLGALKRTYDASIAFKDMHVLDSDYLEINAYHAALKSGEDRDGQVFNITLPDGSTLVQKKD